MMRKRFELKSGEVSGQFRISHDEETGISTGHIMLLGE
jgi:hypothetical protein